MATRAQQLILELDEASASSQMSRILALANGTRFKTATGTLLFEFNTAGDLQTFKERCKKHKIVTLPVEHPVKDKHTVNVVINLS